jgi:CPA1 family monovalent cation:H+ antiporter/cell volume regulation protein A
VPPSLALLLVLFGGLLLLALFLDDIAFQIRLPGILLVLVLGLLIDNNINPGPGQPAALLNLAQADQLAQVALVLVLFFGGLAANWQQMRQVLVPSLRLATLGSLLTAGSLALVVLLVQHLPWRQHALGLAGALFVGAMFCSTDASAVLSLLRPLRQRLPLRLLDLLECESGFNDPIAVVLAGLALALPYSHDTAIAPLLVEAVRQFLLGAFLGFLGGQGAALLLERRRHPLQSSQVTVMALAALMLVAGGSALAGASPLLAAYVMGLVLGNSEGVDQEQLEMSQAGFAKLAELMLFLCLGLVVQPTDVVVLLPTALVLLGVLLLVRWLVVTLLLLRSGFSRADCQFTALAGVRGAVPVAIALQAAASDVPWGDAMPAFALAVVLLGLVMQGALLNPLARRLGLVSVAHP